jgi:hypothetical protein
MAVEGHLYGDRVWFYDARGPVRRMGVSTHPADSTIVISLWQGDTCTGTFRLPAREGAHLVSTLAYGMVEAIPADTADSGDNGDPGQPRQKPLGRRIVGFLRRVVPRTPPATPAPLRLLE